MARRQSSTRHLKRNAAVFGVIFVGVGLIMHFTVPRFNFLDTLGTFVNLAGDFPKVTAMLLGFIILFYVVARVDDRFR